MGQVPYRQVYGDRGVGGGEGLWLYINQVLVVESVSTGSGSQVCHKIDLSPAAVSGMIKSYRQVGVGGGLWLYINKIVVVEILSTGSGSQVCHKIDLSPAAVSGKSLTDRCLG